jgi:hypothetical protein
MSRSSGPQLLLWIDEAGSPEKRRYAEYALQQGFTPKTLAQRLRMDQRDLGRWFKRKGNGNGAILGDIALILKSSVWEVRARVAPENLSADNLARVERALLDDVRTNVEGYREPQEVAKQVKATLASCRPETRRMVLTQYARDRVKQVEDVDASSAAVSADVYWSVTAHEDPKTSIARRDAMPEPAPYYAASEAAVEKLTGLASLPIPLRPVRQPQELARALLMHAECLRKFVRSGQRAFSENDVSHSVTDLLKALAKKGWPSAMLDAARQHYDQYFSEGL